MGRSALERPFVLLAQPTIVDRARAGGAARRLGVLSRAQGATVDMLPRIERKSNGSLPGFANASSRAT